MRYLTVPDAIDLDGVPDVGKPDMPFEDFHLEVLVRSLPMTNGNNTKAAGTVTAKIVDAPAGVELELTDSEHEALEKALSLIQLPGRFRARAIPFYSAIFDAPTKPRTPKPDPDKDAADEPETAEPN